MTSHSAALRLQARALGTEDPDAALALYDRALAAEDATAGDLATALKDKAVTLCMVGRAEEAAPLLAEVIQRYQGSDDPEVAAAVDRALRNEAVMLAEQGGTDEAIARYDEIAARNTARTDIVSRRSLAEALLGRGELVQAKGTDDVLPEAIACYGQVVQVQGKSDDPALLELAVRALLFEAFARFAVHRGFVQLISWWDRRTIFKCLDQALLRLARSSDDSDDCMLLAARAVAMNAQFLNHFGQQKASTKSLQAEALARRFGPERARRIAGFMEAERNLNALAAHAGTKSLGIFPG